MPRRSRTGWRVIFAVALLAQLYGLYAPDQPGPADLFAHSDKVAHCLMFAVVGFTAVRAFGRPVIVLGLLLAHAVASEVVQHVLLATRAGDPWDAASDAVGSLLGVAAGQWRAHARPAVSDGFGAVRVTCRDQQ